MLAGKAKSGDFLLSAIFLTALTLLLVNDFLLKRFAPSVLSGKLSDLAGPIVASLILVAAIEVMVRWLRPTSWARPWWFAAAALLVVTAFAAIKLTATGAELYAVTNTWVLNQLASITSAIGWGEPTVRVSVVEDSVDVVVALFAIPAVIWVGLRWRGRSQGQRPSRGD